MSVTEVKREIPTVARAVELFIQARQNQYTNGFVSVLYGPRSGRVVGRRAAGVTLARSELGGLRFNRVKGHDFVAWLHQRHDGLAASSFKNGRAALSGLLQFAIENEWADETVFAGWPQAKPSPERRDWLRPEQVTALGAFVTERHFSPQQCFTWWAGLNTGARTAELIAFQPRALNSLDGSLKIIGKGAKLRHVPVSPEFQDEWRAYERAHSLRPSAWMFPSMAVRFVDGKHNERFVRDASKHCSEKAALTVTAKVRDLAQQAVERKELDDSLLPSFGLTLQVLRRTFACTNLIAHALLGPGHGMDLRTLQRAMGHSSLETTAIYLNDVDDYINRHRRPHSVSESARELAALVSANGAPPATPAPQHP
jgi:site-specific recombinase XerD